MNPMAHVQLNPFTSSCKREFDYRGRRGYEVRTIQVPPFSHKSRSQSSMFSVQSSPCHPTVQIQIRPFTMSCCGG